MAGTVNGFYQPDTTYTPPTGYTNQAQQLQNTLATLQAGGPTGAIPPQAQLQQQAIDTTGSLANMQTPDSRAGYLNNSQMPMMQDNFDQLARQLYAYDQQHLAPIYTQKPAAPDDALSYGRVGQSDLQQLTPSSVLGASTLYADNPKYKAMSVAAQQNSIIDVLNSLNKAIEGEFNQKKRNYASTVDSQKSALDTILALMGLNNQRDIAKMGASSKTKTKAETDAETDAQILADVRKGITIKDLSNKYAEVDGTHLLDLYNRASPYGPAKEDVGDLRRIGLGVDAGLSTAEKTKADGFASALQQLDRFQKTYPTGAKSGPVAGPLTAGPDFSVFGQNVDLPGLKDIFGGSMADQGLVSYYSDIQPIRDTVLNALSGSAVSGSEQKRVMGWIPDINKTPSENEKNMTSLRNWLQDHYQQTAKEKWQQSSPDTIHVRLKSTGQTGQLPVNEFDASLYEKI